MKQLLYLCLPLLLLFVFSCSKDKEEVDVRDELSGTYSLMSGGIPGLGSFSDIELSKNNSHQERIDFYISGGNISFYGTDPVRLGNNIHFSIPPQLIMISGFPMIIEGKELVSLEQEKQQAVYQRTEQQLQLGLKISLMTPAGPGKSTTGILVAQRKK